MKSPDIHRRYPQEPDVLTEIIKEKSERKYGNSQGLWKTIGNELIHRMPAVPFALFMPLFLGMITLCAGILSGIIVLDSGEMGSVEFAQEYMRRNLNSAVSSLEFRIDTAERLIRIQRQHWENGEWGDSSPALYASTFHQLFATIKGFKGMISTYQYISVAGGLNGYYYNVSDPTSPVLNVWRTDSQGNFTSSIADDNTGEPVTTTISMSNYNASDEDFVSIVLPPSPRAPPIWTKQYGLSKNALGQTLAYALFNPRMEFVAIAGCNIDLGFITNILIEKVNDFHAKLAPPSTYSNMIEYYVFDRLSETILGSSSIESVITGVDVDGIVRSNNLSELTGTDYRLGSIFRYLRSINARLSETPNLSFEIPGYYVETASVHSTFPTSNLHWVLMQVVSEKVVQDKLNTPSKFNYLANISVVAASLVVGLFVSWKITWQLKATTSAIHCLTHLEFDNALLYLSNSNNRIGIDTFQVWNLQESVARLVRNKQQPPSSPSKV